MISPTGGRLLDKVSYCMRKACPATNIIGEKIMVRDTFPYNPDSKTAPDTAMRWAKPYHYANTAKETYLPEVLERRDNVPFCITITDLDVRSEGGRAYKVIDADMRRFDLREDQVLEVMKLVGIQPMGAVPGTFVWGILGSQVRLVLVGGELHKSMVEGANEKKASELARATGQSPTEGTMVPGRIYRKKDKSLHAFIGRVKRGDNPKTFYAFIPMPEKEAPEALNDDDIDAELCGGAPEWQERWKKTRKYEREIARKWSTMTWREKCKYAWDDSYNMYRPSNQPVYTHYEGIVLMASPKFEAEAGELEKDFFEEIKANEKNQHEYLDGNRNSILSTEFKKAHPNEPGYLAVGDVWFTPQHTWGHNPNIRDNAERMTATWHKAKADFYKGLVWL
jgi:hypothetical protein